MSRHRDSEAGSGETGNEKLVHRLSFLRFAAFRRTSAFHFWVWRLLHCSKIVQVRTMHDRLRDMQGDSGFIFVSEPVPWPKRGRGQPRRGCGVLALDFAAQPD
jgi:hypothetical protein